MSKHSLSPEQSALLKDFQNSLMAQGVLEKKLEQHIKNVELYFSFLSKKGLSPKDGVAQLDAYFGDWFIRNAPTASETQIVLSIASLRKFYATMQEQGLVSEKELQQMERTINSHKEDWKEAMDAYSEELSATVIAEGGDEEDDHHAPTPKWEGKTAKFGGDDLGAGEDVDISSGFTIEGGDKDDDDDLKEDDEFGEEFEDEFGDDDKDLFGDDEKEEEEEEDGEDEEFREKYEEDEE